jgi:hypothetical protein
MYFWLPDRVDTMRVTRNIALQTKNKFEGLGDIIHRVMDQLPVPIAVEETVPRSRHRQADITSPSMLEGNVSQSARVPGMMPTVPLARCSSLTLTDTSASCDIHLKSRCNIP